MSPFYEAYIYIKLSLKRLFNNLTLKVTLLWLITCIDFLLLNSSAYAYNQVVNTPGAWDDVGRFFVWSLGPLDRVLLQVIAFFFVIDIFLGLTIAIAKGIFEKKKLFFALLKASVYIILLSVAWQLKKPEIIDIPLLGFLTSLGLEVFILATEAISVIKNSDILLKIIGTELPFLSKMIEFLERNLKKNEDTIFGDTKIDILIVEDTALIRKVIVDFLHKMDLFDINIQGTMDTAIDACSYKKYDVIILDLDLPDSKGINTFIDFVKKVDDIPVIVLLDKIDIEEEAHLKINGCNWFLHKVGLQQAELVSTIILAAETQKRINAINKKVEELELKKPLLPNNI